MNTRQASRPCMIPWVQLVPGSISRGAIQHLIPADSRCAQIASAVGRSLLEWLMKTIDGMLPLWYQNLTRFQLQWLAEKSPGIGGMREGIDLITCSPNAKTLVC